MAITTPEAERDCLLGELEKRQPTIARLERYYNGDHDMPVVQEKVRDQQRRKGRWMEFLKLLKMARANWCELVVEAVVQRIKVVGFHFGDPTKPETDTVEVNAAWRIWQGNKLDARSKLVHRDALTTGYGYALVWPSETNKVGVSITIEHASQCIVGYDDETGDAKSGVKRWRIDSTEYCTLYLPGLVYKWQRTFTRANQSAAKVVWVERHPEGEEWPLPNPSGILALHECMPRPNTMNGGRSELDGLLDIQDRINFTLFNRVLAAWYTSVRQRYVTGIAPEIDEETGRPKELFEQSIDTMLATSNENAKFGEFSGIELGPFVTSVESDIAMMAGIAQMPPHYLLAGIGKASGDALKASESSLVAKVIDRRDFIGEFWEDVIRHALVIVADAGADDEMTEIEWADPEHRTEGELVDALVKMKTLGVPDDELWRRWGASPQQRTKWAQMKAADALLQPPVLALNPAPPSPMQQEPAGA